MSLIVHKYGGTSLSTPSRIRDIAARLARLHATGESLVVVVSAMGGTTSSLQSLAREVCSTPDPRELDMLLTAGERISMSLMSMALKSLGVGSISLTGSQSGIITDAVHNRATIVDVRGDRIREAIEAGHVAIVAGFQGVSPGREVTTLGRGGSDVTAVALGARFDADRCDIYTDVDGVYTANPGRVAEARRIDELDYPTMLRYAELGAGVLHPRAARRAARDELPLCIRSSFIPGPGTIIRASARMPEVLGIGCLRDVIRLVLARGASLEPAVAACGDHGMQVLLRESTGEGALWLDASEAETMRQQLGAEIAAFERGTLIAVVTRPDVDVADRCARHVPDAMRRAPALLTEPGVVATLVDPAAADNAVAALHAALIEAA